MPVPAYRGMSHNKSRCNKTFYYDAKWQEYHLYFENKGSFLLSFQTTISI